MSPKRRPEDEPRGNRREGAEPGPPQAISAADFPALRSFLRGYFHQDMKDEYGSADDAVREFCEDASVEERADVAKEWAKFLDQTKGQPIEAINRILTGKLGSSYSMTEENLEQISRHFCPGRDS